jgi:hypothetical protein
VAKKVSLAIKTEYLLIRHSLTAAFKLAPIMKTLCNFFASNEKPQYPFPEYWGFYIAIIIILSVTTPYFYTPEL